MDEATTPGLSWPGHLAATGTVRFARSSAHYDATVAFYRDVVGLPVIGEFRASFGEDGTIFGLPGVPRDPAPHPCWAAPWVFGIEEEPGT